MREMCPAWVCKWILSWIISSDGQPQKDKQNSLLYHFWIFVAVVFDRIFEMRLLQWMVQITALFITFLVCLCSSPLKFHLVPMWVVVSSELKAFYPKSQSENLFILFYLFRQNFLYRVKSYCRVFRFHFRMPGKKHIWDLHAMNNWWLIFSFSRM